MVDLKQLLARLRSAPEEALQPEITKESVDEALGRRPRRICFTSFHQNALRRQEGARWVGSFSVPFRESIYPIFYGMTSLTLGERKQKLEGQQRPGWWRSLRDEDEYRTVERWLNDVGDLVFLSDQLALSVALSENLTQEGERTPIGELEYQAKYHENVAALSKLLERTLGTIRPLPYYCDADAVCAVPPRQGKGFDLPSALTAHLADQLRVPDLTEHFRWDKQKPALKEVAFDQKWNALENVGMTHDTVKAKWVILVDDLYQSGITMQFVARAILAAGAKRVFGLSVVKSRRDSDNQ